MAVSFSEPTNGVTDSYTVFVYSNGQVIKEEQNYIKGNPIGGFSTGTTYIVRVQALGSGNFASSPQSQVTSRSSITLGTLATPLAPTVAATSNTFKSISVSWTAITNASSYTLKLYSSSNNLLQTSGLVALSGTSATITTSNYPSFADNTSYKVSITANGDGSNYPDSSESPLSLSVTTNAQPVLPVITAQPTNQSSASGSTATFTVTATSSDSGTLRYQWQLSTDSGSTWASVATGTGATTRSYTTATLSHSSSGNRYRVAVTNSKNGATSLAVNSNAATLTVAKANQAPLSPPVLSHTTAAFNGSAYTQALTVTSGGGGSGSGALSITGVANGSATGCAFTAGTLTALTFGTCTLTVTKAEDADFNAATTTATFTFTKANQATLSFTLNPTSAASNGVSFSQALTMDPTGGSGNGATTYAIVSGGSASSCALTNNTASNTITASSAGTCLIQATKAANDNYNSITSALVTFTFRVLSTDNTLGSLTITPGTTSPGFLSGTLAYWISVSESVTTLTVTATPTSPNATVSVDGSTPISSTQFTVPTSTTQEITIRVTAEDPSTAINVYRVSVKRVIVDKSSEVILPNAAPTPSASPRQTTQRIQTPSLSVLPRINTSNGLSTTSGAVLSPVTINGSGFNSVLSVKLNGLKITPNSTSSTAITLTIPVGARSGSFVVTTTKGSVSTPRFMVTG